MIVAYRHFSIVLFLLAAFPALAAAKAELPRLTVDTHYVEPHGRVLQVPADGDFQAALDDAEPGDVIELAAGAVYTGHFVLPKKGGDDWVVIRSSEADRLPPPGQPVDPSMAPLMPKLEGDAAPVIAAAPGAHHYRFIGIEIRPGDSPRYSAGWFWQMFRGWIRQADATPAGFNGQTLVMLGSDESSLDDLPHHIIIDRCYLHGDHLHGTRRGVALNDRFSAVIDSYLSDFKWMGEDAQAIGGWNGAGPFKIENNFLEGSGENVMFGGGDVSVPGLVPSDIVIRRNYFYKPLTWKRGTPHYEGTPWTVKNIFGLKDAQRVLVDGNLFENNWTAGQDGYAVLFTVRTDGDRVPWAVVDDVTFTNNVIKHSESGIDFLGIDDGSAKHHGHARHLTVANNLWVLDGGRLFQLLDGTHDVTIDHNTALNVDAVVFGERSPHIGFVFTNNLVSHGRYGIVGSGTGTGRSTLGRYFPGAVVSHNVMIGGPANAYSDDNFFPASLAKVGFVDQGDGDYRLKASSPYARAASDHGGVGADFKAMRAAMGPLWGQTMRSDNDEH